MPETGERGGGRGDDGTRGDGRPAVRPFWSGTITFGLVSVPVNLFPGQRRTRASLRMVDRDGTPLKRRYYCPAEERDISRDEIVRGYEVEEGRFVVVTDEELEALEPRKSREIDLARFVDRAELDPVYFQRAYFLAPSTDATKPYRLLARVMEESGRAGIASFVMRGKEYLVAIVAENGILRAETMRFHDEIRSAEDVGLPEPGEADADEVERVREAIESLAADELDPDELADRWTPRLEELVAGKRQEGEGVVEPPAEEEPEAGEEVEVIDLMEVLKRNLRGPAGGEGGGDGERPDELRGKTKRELYERARELEIPGRSDMTKDELVRALGRRTS